ncbi:hypothetical protein BpHYR1_007127 [Brachionus plicatilis]|uniref:Uncharacterized protein n=1 Tax=Brachionus plicatilis TaxID=10195 RepID=A0A3M7QDU0_BRAPC|nr:hypothetical protein BpHYR1_007127 [Brachionus plicatilis]
MKIKDCGYVLIALNSEEPGERKSIGRVEEVLRKGRGIKFTILPKLFRCSTNGNSFIISEIKQTMKRKSRRLDKQILRRIRKMTLQSKGNQVFDSNLTLITLVDQIKQRSCLQSFNSAQMNTGKKCKPMCT